MRNASSMTWVKVRPVSTANFLASARSLSSSRTVVLISSKYIMFASICQLTGAIRRQRFTPADVYETFERICKKVLDRRGRGAPTITSNLRDSDSRLPEGLMVGTNRTRIFSLILATTWLTFPAFGALLGPSGVYTENFDSMGTAGTIPPSGWQVYSVAGASNTWINTTGSNSTPA